MIEFEPINPKSSKNESNSIARIKVLGVGGGGSNMVNSMIEAGFNNDHFIIANTDAQALKIAKATNKIQLGVKSTKGLGAGANPEIGRRAAEEDIDRLIDSVADSNIVFLIGGLGGGTGSGALPVIAKALKEKDILTVACVTKPFTFEGKKRMKIAQDALEQVKSEVDTLIVLPNQKLIDVSDQKISLKLAFSLINNILIQFVKSISDIVEKPGYINVDFADVKTIMKHKGFALIGTGQASGENRASKATFEAISSPLLEKVDIAGAQGVLINITSGPSLGLHEVNEAASLIYEKAGEDANIVLGSVIDETLDEEVLVTVIATGFEQSVGHTTAPQVEAKPVRILAQEIRKIEPQLNPKKETEQKNEPKIELKLDNIDLSNIDIPAIIRKNAINEAQR